MLVNLICQQVLRMREDSFGMTQQGEQLRFCDWKNRVGIKVMLAGLK